MSNSPPAPERIAQDRGGSNSPLFEAFAAAVFDRSERPGPVAVERGMAPTAKEAAARAGQGGSVIGWKLDEGQRRELLQQFPPRYARTIADHVTLRTKAEADAPLPVETTGDIVGRVDDAAGVEAMVVAIGGTTDRPDGSTYHVTWSLADGRRAKESNDVLRERDWEPFDLSMPVRLRPARFGS